MSKAIVERFMFVKSKDYDFSRFNSIFLSVDKMNEHLESNGRINYNGTESLMIFMEFCLNDQKFVKYYKQSHYQVDIETFFSVYLGLRLLVEIDGTKSMGDIVKQNYKILGDLIEKFCVNFNECNKFKAVLESGFYGGTLFVQQCLSLIKIMGSDLVWGDIDVDKKIDCKKIDFDAIFIEISGPLVEIVVEYIFHYYIDMSENFIKRIDAKSIDFFKQFRARDVDVILLSHLLSRNSDTPLETNVSYPEHVSHLAETDYENQNIWKTKILNYFKSETFLLNAKLILIPHNIGKIQYMMMSYDTSAYKQINFFDDSIRALLKWNTNFPNGFNYTFRRLYYSSVKCDADDDIEINYRLLCHKCKKSHKEAFLETLNRFALDVDMIKKIKIFVAPTNYNYKEVKGVSMGVQNNTFSKIYWDVLCEFLIANTYCCDTLWDLKMNDLNHSACCWKRENFDLIV